MSLMAHRLLPLSFLAFTHYCFFRGTFPLAFFLCFYLLASCEPAKPLSSSKWHLISARDEGDPHIRPLIYRTLVPANWIRRDPSTDASIVDTKLPLCEFFIPQESNDSSNETEGSIRLTIHTFPIGQNNLRIPPEAQIARWKTQFDTLDLLATHSLPESHGGFSGLFFEGEGIQQGSLIKVMGWSMQLASLYERQLKWKKGPIDRFKRADYTIKVMGPPDAINKHRQDLLIFALSFELIDELPLPP